MKAAVIPALFGGELYHAVVRVRNALGIIKLIALAPYALLCFGISQHLNRSAEAHPSEKPLIHKIYARLWVIFKALYLVR